MDKLLLIVDIEVVWNVILFLEILVYLRRPHEFRFDLSQNFIQLKLLLGPYDARLQSIVRMCMLRNLKVNDSRLWLCIALKEIVLLNI